MLQLSVNYMLLYGGALCIPGCSCYGDTWIYKHTPGGSGAWTQINATDAPIHRYRQNVVAHPSEGAVYLYGGESYQPYMYHNAVNRLKLGEPVASEMRAFAQATAGRHGMDATGGGGGGGGGKRGGGFGFGRMERMPSESNRASSSTATERAALRAASPDGSRPSPVQSDDQEPIPAAVSFEGRALGQPSWWQLLTTYAVPLLGAAALSACGIVRYRQLRRCHVAACPARLPESYLALSPCICPPKS